MQAPINTWCFRSHYLLQIRKICIRFWIASENNTKKQVQVSKALCLGNLIQEPFAATITCDIRGGTEGPSLWTPPREHATQNPFSTLNPSCFRLISLLCLAAAGAQCRGHRGCTRMLDHNSYKYPTEPETRFSFPGPAMQVSEICVEVKQTLKKAQPNLKNLPRAYLSWLICIYSSHHYHQQQNESFR